MTGTHNHAPKPASEAGDQGMDDTSFDGRSKRRAARRPVLTPADAYSCRTRIGSVKVRNISPHGLGGASSIHLHQGQRIQVELAGLGMVAGRVIWTQGLAFGMGFDKDIDIAGLDVAGPLSSMRFTQAAIRVRPGAPLPVLPLRAEAD